MLNGLCSGVDWSGKVQFRRRRCIEESILLDLELRMSEGSIFFCERCMGKDRSGEVHCWSTRAGEESFLLICELRKSDGSLLQFKWIMYAR